MGDSSLRDRFVAAVHSGAEILFSMGHAVEIAGAQGDSLVAVKAFLDELGPHWFPVELKVEEVKQREQRGMGRSACCFDEDVLRSFFSQRTSDCTPGSGRVIDLSPQFFSLGAYVDWLAPSRTYFLQKSAEFDDMLKSQFNLLRAKSKKNPGWLDWALPEMPFNQQLAANFAHRYFMRNLIRDRGTQIRKGDGMDFCHAVMATAFSNFATLDKQWKARVESLPKPNGAPRVYYRPEIGAMVDDLEAALRSIQSVRDG
jgi:hypothetical protein